MHWETSAEGTASHDKCSDAADEDEGVDCVTANAVDDEEFVADDWDELKDGEEACGENGGHVEHETDW